VSNAVSIVAHNVVAALALAGGIGAAHFVRPAAKDDLMLWLVLFAVTVAVTYVYVGSLSTIGPAGSEGGPVR